MWPLEREPVLDPHGEAVWDGSCSSAYLLAWCEVRRHRFETAVDMLAETARGSDRQLSAAAKADLVDLLAESQGAADAMAWLTEHGLSEDAVLEGLAATYAWRAQVTDTLAVDRELSGRKYGDTRRVSDCRWVARGVWAGVGRPEAFWMEEKPACAHDIAVAKCPLVTGRNRVTAWTTEEGLRELANQELSACGDLVSADARLWAAAMVVRWPEETSPSERWLAFARVTLATPRRTPELEDVALTAVENGLVASSCSPEERATAAGVALGMRDHGDHDRSFDGRIDVVTKMTSDACWQRKHH